MSICWRYLRSRRGSRFLSLVSAVSIAGITIGVSALVLIVGVMNGLQTEIRDKILTASPDIRVQPWGADMIMSDWNSAIEKVRHQAGIVAVGPYVYTQGLVVSHGKVTAS